MDTYHYHIAATINFITLFLSINVSKLSRVSFPIHLYSLCIVKRLRYQKRKLNFVMDLGERRPYGKKPGQATSRKGCMKGKGGPENASCPYKGVRQRSWGKWVAEVREPNRGRRLWLGTFKTSHEAAKAYDAAARKLYGSEARLNLPELAASTQLPPPSVSLPVRHPERVNVESETSFYQNIEREIPTYPNSGIDGSSQIPLSGANIGSMICSNSSAPAYEKAEEMRLYDYSENLNVDLLDFDDSSIWEEAMATMDFQALADPGFFFGDFKDENIWEAVKYPWKY